jgi:hypothetical protein
MLTVLVSLFLGIANGAVVGPVTITENGQAVKRYVVSTYAPLAQTNGTAVMLQHDAQVQIAATANASYDPNMFVEYKLKGKTVSYMVDLSQISCSCNSALYFVTMPGIGSNGQPNPGQGGDYYCDANDVNGEWCWELDVQEANMYVTQTTPHQCSQNPGTYISSCDRGGCATNSHNMNANGMGPGSQYLINTQQPFRYAMQLTGTSMSVTMTQGSNTFKFDVCSNNAGYVSNMNEALDYGMVMVMSYWGSTYATMQWLDGNTGCSGDCAGSGYAIFNDISIG